MTSKTAALALLLAAAPSAAAVNPRLAGDFDLMMEWLASESAEGLSFHSSVAFDPPVELKPGEGSLDGNFGVGTIPVQKGGFPRLSVKTLQDMEPEENFSDVTPFPDMTTHLRVGLPRRWELGLRLSNMTVPRHPISSTTEGEGQSNIYGLHVRKHYFGGPRRTRLTLGGNLDYLHGGFKFYNGFQQVEITDTLFLDSANEGRLHWDVKSIGATATVSDTSGKWTPYCGLGYHYSWGYVRGRLTTRFNSTLVPEMYGSGTSRLDGAQIRFMGGTMRDMGGWQLFASVESLMMHDKAGKTFAAHMGFSVPLRRRDKRPAVPKDLRDAPGPVETRPQAAEELPDVIILQ